MAMHILMATLDALNIPADELVLNYTTLYELREKNREDHSEDAKTELFDKVIFLNISLNIYYLICLMFVLHSFCKQ